jgi:FlaA1/EpsC-like NDP-sugar epimerase
VRCVVALSTDKAVKPVNAMGISKAMMEKIVAAQNLLPTDTIFCCVRYGNVMNSRGSVVPLFRSLIRSGQPMRVTVPEMTRFLLTLDQSVDLVRHAMTMALGGEIFVRKAPACTVIDLADAMRRKYSPMGADHPIEVVGIRPGEKIHEVLVNEYEIANATEDETFITIHPEYRRPTDPMVRPHGYEYTSDNTERVDDPERLSALLDAAGDDDVYI